MLGFILGCLYIIFAIFTYSFIMRRVRRSRQQLRATNVIGHIQIRREFLLPTILISTGIMFYTIPMLILNIVQWKGNEVEKRSRYVGYNVCYILLAVGVVADALTFSSKKLQRYHFQNLFQSST